MSAPSWAEPYLNRMNSEDNGYGFFWGEFPNPAPFPHGGTGSTGISEYPCSDHTWLKFNTISQIVPMYEEAYNSGYTQAQRSKYAVYGVSTKLTLTITTGETYVTGVLDNISVPSVQAYNPDNPSQSWGNAIVFYKDSYGIHVASGNVAYNYNNSYTWTDTTVEGILQQVYKCLRNVYVIVDGDNWTAEITYTWQSVPSISGKNGILSLVTLGSESINDGEPVSGAAVSVFDQAPSNDNNIKNLADTYGGGEASSAVDVTVKYKVTLPPGGSFSVLKLVAKKDSIPEDVSDGDKIVDISPSKTKKTVTGLDENSLYYFKIFAEDTNSNTSESDEKHIMTSGDEGWSFDYTGEIQTFTAPKTGIYQLETWGAQGGDATDGTNSARGGYGAYAVGEVFLTQGDTLYINVGGQNGYGGGGNYDYNDYMIVQPDANGYILDAHAASDGFHDRISGRKMKVIDGNFDNFTYDSTNDWITFGQGCDSLFGFFTKIPEDLIMSITAIDFELEGKWTQTCSSSALKFLGRITLQSDRETYGGTMDCVFVRGGRGNAPALTLTRQNSGGSPYWQTVFDSDSVIYDGVYNHWKNLEEVITYHMDLSNGVVTYSSQHCTQGVGAGTRIRANDSDYNNIILNSGDYLKIVCGSLQGFNARAYRIKVTQ